MLIKYLCIYTRTMGTNKCFVLMIDGGAWSPYASRGSTKSPPLAPGSPQVGDPPFPLPPAPEPLTDDEGYDTDILDIWAGDDRYDIWAEENDDGSSDSDSVVSVIDISESLEIIEISSDEDFWSSGLETNNSSDLDYQTRGWNQKRKQRGQWGARGSQNGETVVVL